MPALIGNLAPWELLVIAVVAVIVFGKSLPQVAAKGYMQLRRLRRSMEELRRESGIDREMRSIEREMRDAEREASLAAARLDEEPRAPAGDTSKTDPAEEREGEGRS